MTQDSLSERRANVSTFLLAGISQSEIADRLGVSPATVSRDVKVLRKQWAEKHKDVDHLFDIQLARIEEAITAIYESVLRGNLQAIDRFVRLIEVQNRMVGLNADDRLKREKTETDWRAEAAQLIRDNDLPFDEVASEVGYDWACQLFEQAGLAIPSLSKDENGY